MSKEHLECQLRVGLLTNVEENPCSAHHGVAKISFTGSTATGQRIAEAAAKHGAATCMELGGKSCLIVFDDADIEDAVEWACFGCFWTNGQARFLMPSTREQ